MTGEELLAYMTENDKTTQEAADHFDISLLGLELDIEKRVLSQMPADQWIPWIDHHIAREPSVFPQRWRDEDATLLVDRTFRGCRYENPLERLHLIHELREGADLALQLLPLCGGIRPKAVVEIRYDELLIVVRGERLTKKRRNRHPALGVNLMVESSTKHTSFPLFRNSPHFVPLLGKLAVNASGSQA